MACSIVMKLKPFCSMRMVSVSLPACMLATPCRRLNLADSGRPNVHCHMHLLTCIKLCLEPNPRAYTITQKSRSCSRPSLNRFAHVCRCQVVQRRARFNLTKANKRLHLVQGFLTAMSDLDEVVKVIRAATDGMSCMYILTNTVWHGLTLQQSIQYIPQYNRLLCDKCIHQHVHQQPRTCNEAMVYFAVPAKLPAVLAAHCCWDRGCITRKLVKCRTYTILLFIL